MQTTRRLGASSSTRRSASSSPSASSTTSTTSSSAASSSTSSSSPSTSSVTSSASSHRESRDTGEALSTTDDLPPIVSNPTLTFSRPDAEQIDADARDLRCIPRLMNWPWGEYRSIDYLRAALRMFVVTLRSDFNQCTARAHAAGRSDVKFTWQNRGLISEHFAIFCDCAKIVHEQMRVKGVFPTFLNWLILHVIVVSRVPRDVLSERTYAVKVKDWEKGGTRYRPSENDSSTHHNVLYAQVNVRRQKLEQFLQSHAVAAAPAHVIIAAQSAPTAPTNARMLKSKVAIPAGGGGDQQQGTKPRMVPLPAGGPGPAFGQRTAARTAHQVAESSIKHRAQLLIGPGAVRFPAAATGKMNQFVQVCRDATAFLATHMWLLLLVLRAAHHHVRQGFEAAGGLVVVQQWVARRVTDLAALHREAASLPRDSPRSREVRAAATERSAGLVVLLKTTAQLFSNLDLRPETVRAWRQAPRTPESSTDNGIVAAEGAESSAPISREPSEASQGVGGGEVPAKMAAAAGPGTLDWIRAAKVTDRVALEYSIKALSQVVKRRTTRHERGEGDGGDGAADEEWRARKHEAHRNDRLRRATLLVNEAQQQRRIEQLRVNCIADEFLPLLRAGPLPTYLPDEAADSAVVRLELESTGGGGGSGGGYSLRLASSKPKDGAASTCDAILPCGIVYDPLVLLSM